MIARLFSFLDGLFSGAMLVLGRVSIPKTLFFCHFLIAGIGLKLRGFGKRLAANGKLGCWGNLSRMVAGRSACFMLFRENRLKYNLVEVSYTVIIPIYPDF